jgi:hypothetical protein
VNLSDLREAIRVRTGYPERGDTGTKRLNHVINQSLRSLWGEMPEVLLEEEYRLMLEPPISFEVKRANTDRKLLKIIDPSVDLAVKLLLAINQKTFSGRWIEWNHNGTWYSRRIAEVFIDEGTFIYYVTVTEPIANEIIFNESSVPAGNNSATVFTYEYPYDADIQTIRRIVKNPETNPREIPLSLVGGEMSKAKISSGWRSTGNIQYYSRGTFYQQPAPHYELAPLTGRDNTGGSALTTSKWGFNDSNVEQPDWGAAGEFSYVVCHVWGRHSNKLREIDGARGGALRDSPDGGMPFYISAPSKPSKRISVAWGKPAVRIVSPDIDYSYGFSEASGMLSYHRSGVEKWIFRARHATDRTIPPATGSHKEGTFVEYSGTYNYNIPIDGIYYLWKVVDASETETIDRGEWDPPSFRFRLKDFVGHNHIRFDKRPSSEDQILVTAIKRPPILEYDTDSPRLPPECYGCIIELACSYLVGDRDGDMKRKAIYYDSHLLELQKLKRMYTFSGHERPSFGNGMRTSSYSRIGDYPVTETS